MRVCLHVCVAGYTCFCSPSLPHCEAGNAAVTMVMRTAETKDNCHGDDVQYLTLDGKDDKVTREC